MILCIFAKNIECSSTQHASLHGTCKAHAVNFIAWNWSPGPFHINKLLLQLAELEHLAGQTKDHVIHLGPATFDRFASGRRRPYTLIFFLTAHHLLDKPQLQLGKLRREFGLLSAQVHCRQLQQPAQP